MKKLNSTLQASLILAALIGATQASRAAGVTTWVGAVQDQNWSTAGNWTTVGGSTPPGTTDSVVFTNGAYPVATNNATAVDNIVTASATIGALSFVNTNGGANNFYHTTQIASGQTLTVNGNVFVGVDNANTTVHMQGPGNFTVSGGSSSVFGIGADPGTLKCTSQTATLVLGDGNNTITTATNLICFSGNNNSKPAILSLGNGANVLNANQFTIGSGKDRGTLNFANAGAGTLKIRALDGVSRANMSLAIDGGGSASSKATVTLTGHSVDLLLNTLTNGSAVAGGGVKDSTLAFDTGTVDVNNLIMAVKGGIGVAGFVNNSTNTVAGTGVLNVNNNFVMSRGATTTAGTTNHATLNINGTGVVHSFCDIIRDPLSLGALDIVTIAMNGGTLDIQGHNIGPDGNPIDNLVLNGSTLSNLTAVSGATIPINIATLNLSGANQIAVKTLPVIQFYPTNFHLISYTAETGSATWNAPILPGSYVGTIVDSGSSIDVSITSGPIPAKNITWNGNVNGNWDTSTANWLNGVSSATYNQGDLATFDDTLTGTSTVNLTTTLNPGSLTFNNNKTNYVFTGTGNIGGTVTVSMNGAASLLLDNTSANSFTGGFNITSGTVQVGTNDDGGSLGAGGVTNNGAIVLNNSNDATFANPLFGAGTLSQVGTNVATLSGVSPLYTGNVTIQNGTLRIATTNALGSWSSGTVTITNGGTLDIGGIPSVNLTVFGGKQFFVSGTGVGGNGAIVNNGPSTQQDAFSQITMTANTTIGGTNRWDLRNGGATLNQNGFTLTKNGTAETSLVSPTINNYGNFIINGGILSFEVAPVFNGGTGTVTVNAGGTLGQYKMNAGAFTLPVMLNGGAIENMATSAGVGVNDSPITLTANSALIGVTIAGNNLTLNGVINETGGSHGLTKSGASPFTFTANSTYSGNTVINQGPLALSGVGSISNSAAIILQSNAVFDVSAVSYTWTLEPNQTLSGLGGINGAATIDGTVAPGTSSTLGTLTFSNALTLTGINVMKLSPTAGTNDVIDAPTSVAYGGVLIVTNIDGAITNGQTFQLFNSLSISGGFSQVLLPAATGLTWTNNLAASGSITAGVAGGPVSQPVITGLSISGTALTINGTNGSAGNTFSVLVTTDLSVPLANWTVVPAGTFGGNNFTNTITINPALAQQFYRIQVP